MSVENRIQSFVQQRFVHNRAEPLTTTESLLDSGLVDSAGIFDLVAYLEGEFNVEVQDEEITPEHFENVSSIAAFVEQKL